MRPRTILQHLLLFNIALLLFTSSYALAKAGQLDTTFANGGLFEAPSSKSTENAMALQRDGKIVVAGIGVSGNDFADVLLRLNPDGTLDKSFGTGGVVDVSPGGTVEIRGFFAAAIQSDGKIIAAADALNGVQVVRVEANGSLDSSFGNGGVTSLIAVTEAAAGNLAVQADGKILLVAGFGNPSLMARFTTSGQPDTSFGAGGLLNLPYGSPTQVAIQSDGKILVAAGESAKLISLFPTAQAGAITRYNSNGTVDKTFGAAGTAASAVSASALVLQSDGKIVVGGTITSKAGAPLVYNRVGFGIVRYDSNGSVDLTFGKEGVAITDFGTAANDSGAFALAIQADGDIVAAGAAGAEASGSFIASGFGLSRYSSAGKLDTSFGTNGIVITAIGSGHISWLNAMAIQSDGKIVVAGTSDLSFEFQNGYVARYLSQ
jgi:uncharacterized delta-60 repeat protein